jgi:hypothetical protein
MRSLYVLLKVDIVNTDCLDTTESKGCIKFTLSLLRKNILHCNHLISIKNTKKWQSFNFYRKIDTLKLMAKEASHQQNFDLFHKIKIPYFVISNLHPPLIIKWICYIIQSHSKYTILITPAAHLCPSSQGDLNQLIKCEAVLIGAHLYSFHPISISSMQNLDQHNIYKPPREKL